MNIVFMGSKQAGMIALLTLCTMNYDPELIIPYDESLKSLADLLKIPIRNSINDVQLEESCINELVSVHGREIVSDSILKDIGFAINVHPMLSKYKGINPIGRFIVDSLHGKTDDIASVGCHRMTQNIDGGEILSEHFIKIDTPWEKSIPEIYNELYPLYPVVLMEALKKVCQ